MAEVRHIASTGTRRAGGALMGVTAAVMPMFAPGAALALDLDGEDGLITETVARRERLKDYDTIKKYGAERVMDRDRRALEADGLRSGNYLIFPSVGLGVLYDDNIFALDIDKRSDFRSEITPKIKFVSQLPRHVLDFQVDGKLVNYAHETDQDYANVRGIFNGALHFDHAHTLSLTMVSALDHEERDDPDSPLTAVGPVPVFNHKIAAGITRDVGRLYGTFSTSYEQFNYQDVRSVTGSQLDQDGRDTDVMKAELKLGYRFSPGYDWISKFRVIRSDNAGTGSADADATGWEALAGLSFETNPLLRWRLLGGYGMRDYDHQNLGSVNFSLIQGEVQWLATQRMTLYGTVSREITDTVNTAGDAQIETNLNGRLEYEIYHNLFATGSLEFMQGEYLQTDRVDNTYGGKIGLDWYYTKNILLTLSYEHQVRDSNVDTEDMTRNRVWVGGKISF